MTTAGAAGADLRVEGETELARAVAARGLVRSPEVEGSLVFIDHPTDAETAAAIVPHLAGEATIVAQIRNAPLRRAIRERLAAQNRGPRTLLFGLAAIVARAAVAGERLYDQAWWRGQPRVHVVVAGFGDLARACLTESVMAGIAGGLAPPRITIVESDPETVEARLSAEWPELGESAELAVARSGPGGGLAAAVVAAETASPLTAVFLCLGDDARQASALLDLDRLRRGRRGLAPVLALSETGMPLAALACPVGRRHDAARRSLVRSGWPGPVETALVAAGRRGCRRPAHARSLSRRLRWGRRFAGALGNVGGIVSRRQSPRGLATCPRSSGRSA